MYLPENEFKQVIKNTPLISIDLLIVNTDDKYLFGKRSNRPAKGFWFVPGGRIVKNENIEEAFKRLTESELGNAFSIQQASYKGVYEHFYQDSFVSENVSTHYIVLAYQLSVNLADLNLPTEQHSCYQWMTAEEALLERKVHLHSKWYFD